VTQSADAPTAELLRGCPYVGLIPFTESESAYFFGRERDIEIIVANLTAARLTLLYAASGVGKSSVLRAGVVPRLRALAEEDTEDLGIPGNAVAYVSEWSGRPDEVITAALCAATARTPGASELPAELVASASFDVDWLRQLLERSGVSGVHLILDQFEEYFLYHPTDDGSESLATRLGDIMRARDLPVQVLVSVREDALACLDRFKGRVPRLFDNYLRLSNLGVEAARTAVEGPLKRYNELAPADRRMSIEPELVTTILGQVRTGQVVVDRDRAEGVASAADPGHVETPYLQLVLTRLWERERSLGSTCLRRETLDALGGAQTIVQTHLDEVMAALTPEQVDVAAAVFHHLVTRSGSKVALAPEDLADRADLPVERVHDLLETLCTGPRRILRPVPPATPGGLASYEIYHDVMGAAVLDWRRRYVAERDKVESSRRLVAEREQAQAATRAARRRLRWARLVAVVMAGLLVLSVVLGVKAYQSGRQVEQRALLSESAAVRDSDPDLSLQRAVRAYQIEPSDPDARQALLLAASSPRGNLLVDPTRDTPVVGVVAAADGKSFVAFDGRGGVTAIGDDGQVTARRAVQGLGGSVMNASVSPDGGRVVVATDRGGVAVLDVATGAQTVVQSGGDGGSTTGWLGPSDGGLVLVTAWTGATATYDGATGKLVARIPGTVYEALPASDGQHVVTTEADGVLRVWDARSGALVTQSSALTNPQYLRNDGQRVVAFATSGSDQSVAVWDWQAGPDPAIHKLQYWYNSLNEVSVDEQAGTVRVATDKDATVYSLADGSLQSDLPDHPDLVYDVAQSPDGQWLATADGDGKTRVWFIGAGNPYPNQPTYVLPGHGGGVLHVRFLRGGSALLTAGLDGAVRRWDLPAVPRLSVHQNWVADADVSRDGTWVASIGVDYDIFVSAVADLTRPPVAKIELSAFGQQVRFDPTDPHRIFSLTTYGKAPEVRRWTETGVEQPLTFDPLPEAVYLKSFVVTADGARVMGGDTIGGIDVWDARTGRLLAEERRQGASPAARSVAGGTALDPTGELLAVTVHDGVELWRPATPDAPRTLPHTDAAYVAFSDNGDRLVSASQDGSLKVWSRSGELLRTFSPNERVGKPAFGPGGRLLAVGTADGQVEVWDVESGVAIMSQRAHSEFVNDVEFAPGTPTTLVTASDDRTVARIACPACDDQDAVIRQMIADGADLPADR
jgi:WD40 repeat protein